ncbi:MAG: polysaccharide deacetylase family protein [Bacteroidia bacterium]
MTTEKIIELLQIKVQASAPEILIYSKNATARLKYVLDFVFHHQLNIRYRLENDIELFSKSKEPKINYSENKFDNSIHIVPSSLLSEKKLNPNIVLDFKYVQGFPVVFKTDQNDDLGFDIFSAVFYFISRYEEWQVTDLDVHGRFEARNSILKSNGILDKPVLDIWTNELKRQLQTKFPNYLFPTKKFTNLVTIDVDNLFAFKGKSLSRSIGSSLKDLAKGNFKQIKTRWKVIIGLQKDPFDVYERINNLSIEKNLPVFFFFLQKSGTKFDRTVNPSSDEFNKVIKALNADNINVGLHPSYNSSTSEALLRNEKEQLESHAGRNISTSRQHYLRFDIEKTPDILLNSGIKIDFSVGFASEIGYRAGTFTPFYHFDFNKEIPTELLRVPFVIMDGTYFIYSSSGSAQAIKDIESYSTEVKKLGGGLFVSVFHERTFDPQIAPGFNDVFEELVSLND